MPFLVRSLTLVVWRNQLCQQLKSEPSGWDKQAQLVARQAQKGLLVYVSVG